VNAVFIAGELLCWQCVCREARKMRTLCCCERVLVPEVPSKAINHVPAFAEQLVAVADQPH
jgi:hypothetical protein